jgi:hypothetical protein
MKKFVDKNIYEVSIYHKFVLRDKVFNEKVCEDMAIEIISFIPPSLIWNFTLNFSIKDNARHRSEKQRKLEKIIDDKINWLTHSMVAILIINNSPMIIIKCTKRQIDFIISSLIATCELKSIHKDSISLKGSQ